MDPNDAHWNANRKFFDTIFPFEYRQNGLYARMNPYPANSLAMNKRDGQNLIIKRFSERSGLSFIDVDLASCHPRVISHIYKERPKPWLEKACNDPNFWLEEAKKGKPLVEKALAVLNPNRKEPISLKIKCFTKILKTMGLATLNGGGVGNKDHFSPILADGHPTFSPDTRVKVETAITKYIQNWRVAKEFRQIQNDISDLNVAHLMHNQEPYQPGGAQIGRHGTISQVMASGEAVCLTYLVEYLGGISKDFNVQVVPVALIHDGLIALASSPVDDPTKEKIKHGFRSFINEQILMDMPIKFEQI